MGHFYLKLSFLFLISFSQSYALASYSISDLEVLESEKNFTEFLQHAKDIRPKDRDRHWKEMVANMGELFLDSFLSHKDLSLEDYKKSDLYSHWPIFIADEFFQDKREKIAMRYLRECFKSQKLSFCKNHGERFFEGSRKNPEVGIQLLKLLKKYDQTISAWDYVKGSLKDTASSFYCKEKDVFLSIMKKIQLMDINGLAKAGNIKDELNSLMNQDCLQVVTKNLKTRLYSEDQNSSGKVYLILSAFKKLDRFENDLFLAHYFLKGPLAGETYNRSWNLMKALGSDLILKEKIVSSFKNRDLLPGGIFSLKTQSKRRVALKHLQMNFPEYIQFYGETCVRYLYGRGSFPRGNPTLECHSLFNDSKSINWLSKNLKTDYWNKIKGHNRN
jgi:hypothetical protein